MDDFLAITIGLVSYILLLFLFRKMNIWKKKECNNCNNCCPDCERSLERIKREKIDYLINYLTFQIFDFKRYQCVNCAWKGRRWERSFSGKF
ncbi:MAG: hypothetical protein P8J34_01980 [Flavobacteriales bacterium]|nr:hypothetical protein [Flavobacteriales bacterium]